MTRRGFFTVLFGGLASGVLAKYLSEQKAPPKKITSIACNPHFTDRIAEGWIVTADNGDGTCWAKMQPKPPHIKYDSIEEIQKSLRESNLGFFRVLYPDGSYVDVERRKKWNDSYPKDRKKMYWPRVG